VTQKMLIPAYFDPTAFPALWTQMAGAPPGSVIVMNPASGPGSSSNPAYVSAVAALQAAGMKVVGYVDTNFGAVSSGTAETQVTDYKTWYAVDGIFFDRTSILIADETYYTTLATFVRSTTGTLVVLNCGGIPDVGYMSIGDIVVIFEDTYANYVSYTPPGFASGDTAKVANLVHTTTSAELQNAMYLSVVTFASWIYVTNDTLPNPYDTLPSFRSAEIAFILNAAGQIAQFIVPSDAIGNPNGILLDWAHSTAFLFGTGGLRSYDLAFATQSPIGSLATAPSGGFTSQGCIDSRGNLILATNPAPVGIYYKVDPNTLLVTGSFGTGQSTIFVNYPFSLAEITVGYNLNGMACVNCNGVDYCLIKEGTFSTAGGIIRTDTMEGAGFLDTISTSSVNGESMICAGKSGATATFFSADIGGVGNTNTAIHKVTITAGAEAWTTGEWPTPNPNISVSLLTTLTKAAIRSAWTGMTPIGMGYDALNDLVVIAFTSSVGDDAVTQVVAVDPTSGAIVQNTQLPAAPSGRQMTGLQGLFGTQIAHGDLIATDFGSDPALWEGLVPKTGLIVQPLDVNGLAMQSGQPAFSGDVAKLGVVYCDPYTAGPGAPVPVSGTTTGFVGWAMVNLWPGFPGPAPTGGVQFHLMPVPGMIEEAPLSLEASAAIAAGLKVSRVVREKTLLSRRNILRQIWDA
jgi:hypothetical protein